MTTNASTSNVTTSVPQVTQEPQSSGNKSVSQVTQEIEAKAQSLERESNWMRFYHQTFTVLTILLGIAAPAFVTYTPPSNIDSAWWKIIVIAVTAFATAAATIRTVLRFNERFSNSALTSIALLDLEARVNAQKEDIIIATKAEYLEKKLYETSAWARTQMLEIMKAYIVKEVSALTQEHIALAKPPEIKPEEQSDSTRK